MKNLHFFDWVFSVWPHVYPQKYTVFHVSVEEAVPQFPLFWLMYGSIEFPLPVIAILSLSKHGLTGIA